MPQDISGQSKPHIFSTGFLRIGKHMVDFKAFNAYHDERTEEEEKKHNMMLN